MWFTIDSKSKGGTIVSKVEPERKIPPDSLAALKASMQISKKRKGMI
jgi:hypothetical protein